MYTVSMIDLREELRQRLSAIDLEKATIRERLTWLDHLTEQVKGLLEFETMRVRSLVGDQPGLFPGDNDGERSMLSMFIRDALNDGLPHTLDDLKRVAQDRGMQFGDKNPGRVLHFALLGMAQNGVVEMVDKGIWKLARETAPR